MALDQHFKRELQEHEKHDRQAAVCGCVTKCIESGQAFRSTSHGAYRRNGYEKIKGDPERLQFYDRDQGELRKRAAAIGITARTWSEDKSGGNKGDKTRVRSIFRDPYAWHFPPKGDGANFKGGNDPYPHNYHHILPWSSIAMALEPGEAVALQVSGYNLNDGVNMIVLPMHDRVALVLGTYKHPNDHRDYNKHVAKAINEVKGEIKGDKPQKEAHLTRKQAKQLNESLSAWENDEFFVLMRKGRRSADQRLKPGGDAKHVDEHQPSPIKVACDGLNGT